MTAVMAATRAELMRLRKWPAVWITLGAWLTLALLFGYLFNYLSYRTGDRTFSTRGTASQTLLAEVLPANVPHVLIQGMPMFGGALMMVFGALAAGSGYGWGTWKTIFTQGSSRTRSVLGSFLALAVFVVGLVLLTLVFFLALALGIAGLESQTVVWPALGDVAKAVGAGVLILLMWTMLGYALGTIARSPALSVGLGLVWVLVVENLLRGVGNLLAFVEAFIKVLPGTGVGSLVGSLVGVTPGSDGTPGVLTILSGTQALGLVLAYVVVLPILTITLVRRRDVS